jgi:predicted acylesterase/phospholipase RssA
MGERAKIGLALGGGGARGLAHLGVLKVLEREVNMFQRAMKMFTGPRKIFRAGEGMF